MIINYLDYTYQSDKGQAKDGDIFNGALKGSFSDKDYSSRYVNGETFKATAGQTVFNLRWTPVDTRGVNPITNQSVAPTVTINGTTEVPTTDISVTANGTLTLSNVSLSADDEVVITYYYMNEVVRSNGFGAFGTNGETANDGAIGGAGFTNVPEIGLKMQSTTVEAQARTLRAYWGFTAEYELSKDYGQNMSDLLAEQAAAEITHKQLVA